MKYIINVTQNDIDNGKRKSCHTCPVALAIKRATDKHLSVGNDRVYLHKKENDISEVLKVIMLPIKVTKFIYQFDRRFIHDIEPFSFELEI